MHARFASNVHLIGIVFVISTALAGCIEIENQTPDANNLSLATDEDTPKAITLAGNDSDGSISTYTVSTNPVHGALSGTAPNLTYTPAANYFGSDSFTFTVTDNEGATSAAVAVSITVNSVNDGPTATGQTTSTNEDTPKAITLAGSDSDGSISTYTVSTNPVHGALSGTAPNLTYTPAANYFGSDSFTFTVTDNEGATSAAVAVSITVNSVNDGPTATGQTMSTNEDTPKAITLAGNDSDGSISTYTVSTNPVHGALSGTGPNLTYTPAANYFGGDSFTFTVTDNEGATSVAVAVSITVNSVNDRPTATGQTTSTNEDIPEAITLAGNDSDGSISTYTVSTNPAYGALSGTAPNLTYTPAANYFGSDSFAFTVTDNEGATSAAATVSITVNSVNDEPTAAVDSFSATGNTKKTFAAPGVLANDSDTESPSNALTATTGTIATSKGGSVTMSSNGSFVYTPPANISSDSFQYTLNDNDGVDPNSDVGTANISLSGMVWYVDDSAAAGGDGTSEKPFNTLAAGAAAASSAETIFVYSGSYSGGITLTTAGQLIGEGEGLSVSGLTIAAGTPPTITATGGVDAITVSNGNTIKGVTLTGNASSIRGAGITGLTVQNVTLSNTGGDSISLSNSIGTVSLSDSSITNSSTAVDGLDIDNSGLATGILILTVDGLAFSGDTTLSGMQNAVDIITSTSSTINATITGSSFTNTWKDGIEIDINGTSGSDSITIGNSSNRNTFTGVSTDVMDFSVQAGSSVSFNISGNDTDGNGLSLADGIDLFVNDNATSTINIIDNSFVDLGDSSSDKTIKIFVGNLAVAHSRADITISNNSLINNTATGLLIDNFGDSDVNATVSNNTFSANGNNDGLTVITTIANTETCLAASGNTFSNGDHLSLTETADGSFLQIPSMANAAALSASNGGVTVNTTGGVGYAEACSIP